MTARYEQGWIGVDLDGTLAEHYWPQDGPYDPFRIGPPVAPMVERVKAWLAAGREVRIFTARVGPNGSAPGHNDAPELIAAAIKRWTREHIGVALEVTCTKDYGMTAIWDDRAVRVQADKGRPCCDHYRHGSS